MKDSCHQRVRYTKASVYHGTGNVPVGACGNIILVARESLTDKALVDFEKYGKAIIPLSCLEMLE
ncbi:MAG TPA: hypothetical protein H9673_02305 [Candidatus Adamsella sp.]|nr:hypothetical protein [Candidatus Adamsella sp.]